MEPKQLSQNQEALLKKPLPPEAVKQHPTKAYLSTIKAIYVIERFNDVFGVGRWTLENQFIAVTEKLTDKGDVKRMVIVETRFRAPEYGINLPSFGGNDNEDEGDAYKGAVTDAVTKIGAYLGIGMDVFKGLHDKKDGKAVTPPKVPEYARSRKR